MPVPCVFRQPVVISRRPLYLRIPRPQVHYEANQEEHDEDEETDSGNLSCGKSHKSKPKGTRYQCDQKENQRVIQHDGTSPPSRDLMSRQLYIQAIVRPVSKYPVFSIGTIKASTSYTPMVLFRGSKAANGLKSMTDLRHRL